MHHILLIELSATLRHLASRLIEDRSDEYSVHVAQSYTDALEHLNHIVPDEKSVDDVLIGWPERTDPDADEIIALLSESRYKGLNVIVLAQEADTAILDWVTRRSRTALVLWDDYRECLKTLENIREEAARPSTPEFSTRELNARVRVLFVDDSPTVRVNFRRLLRANGYDADTASSVREGMETALENHYDIAIIDYFLPDGTGDQLCAQLRDNPNTARVTCAVITGTYHDKVIKDSLEAGAVECMFKNEADELFLARIASMSRMKQIVSSIEKDHKQLEGILTSVGDGVYGVNNQGLITFINPAAKEIVGYDRNAQLRGKSAHSLFHAIHDGHEDHEEHEDRECHLCLAYVAGRRLVGEETLFRHANGQLITVECTVYPLKIDEHLEGSVVAFRDVTERKLLQDELKWQATHDSLTKLSNRYYFEEQLRNEVKRLKRSEEQSALLYLDLDRFKYINDTAGHAAGDKLLIQIGQLMSSRLRSADTLARIGGDEFAMILRNISEEQATDTAEMYRDILEKFTFYHDGKSYVVNASIGMVVLNKETASQGEALANADLACFIAKGRGRNQTHLFDETNDEKANMDKDLGWSAKLREAVSRDMFELYFQPILPLKNLETGAAGQNEQSVMEKLFAEQANNVRFNEVLLRLPDSRGEMISPDAFLPTAERFNMMNDIDRWVIRHSIRTMANMQQDGVNTLLSINLSAQTLEDTSLPEYVKDLTEEAGVDPSHLLFEVTENSAIANLEAANRLIRNIRALGCRFALDDFGRGFCSFSHLKFLPVDFIKIDGIFVQGLMHDQIDRAIVNSVVQIAHSVGKQTVAEYVENIEVIHALKEIGVDYIQGNYVSIPHAVPEVYRYGAKPDQDDDADNDRLSSVGIELW